jgi:hypothetical protein
MRINFGLDTFLVDFTIEMGTNIQKQTIEAPRFMIEQQFLGYVQQIANDSRPIRVSMSRDDRIWDNFENKWRDFEHKISFCNKAWENS